MKGDFDSIIEPARKSVRTVQKQITDAKTELNNLKNTGFSPDQDIDNAINQIESGVNDVVPQADEEAIGEINDIISSCTYLKDDSLLKNPTAILKSMAGSAFEAVQDVVDAVSLDDYTPGKLIDALVNKVASLIPDNPESLGIAEALKKADELIQCLNAVCGPSFASIAQDYADEIDDLYDKFNIVGNPADPNYGKFDVDKLYNDVGLSAIEKGKMEKVVKSIQDSKQAARSQIDSAVATTKSIRKSALQIL
jgi:hypothetical protein